MGILTVGLLAGALALPATPVFAPVGEAAAASDDAKAPAKKGDVTTEDVVVGKGRSAYWGDRVTIHYAGRLRDGGKEFDNSRKRGDPLKFRLGDGEVIRGLERGIKDMRVGGKRVVTIPPELGYGKKGAGKSVPPNATLVFEVELVKVE